MNKRLGIIILALLLILLTGFTIKSRLTIEALSESIQELQFEQENLRGKIYALKHRTDNVESILSDLENSVQEIDNKLTSPY